MWATITLTTRCNLNCKYCYFAQDNNIARDMDLILAKKIVSWLHENGCRGAALFGGEPTLLGGELIKIIEFAAQEKRMYVYFSTNGFLLARDKKFLEDICKAGASVIAYAVDCVDFVDGMPKKINYQLLENLILMREKYKIRPQFNTVITKANVSEIYKLAEVAKIHKIPITSRLFNNHSLNRAIHDCYNPQLFTFNTEEDLIKLNKLITYLMKLKKENSIIIDSSESLLRIPGIARGIDAPFDCTAGKYTLSFGSQGRIYSCVDEMIEGPIFHQNLKDDQIFDENVLHQTIKKCSALCTACAELQTAYLTKHPLEFFFKFPK